MSSVIEQFANDQLNLIELEREAELEQLQSLRENVKPAELEAKGLCLTKLHVRDSSTGLYGRFIVSFSQGSLKKPKNLPSNTFGPGDIVRVHSPADIQSKDTLSGMVVKITDTLINVAFSDDTECDWNERYQITKLLNDVTYRRLKLVLNSLKKIERGHVEHLKNVLFGLAPPSQATKLFSDANIHWFNEKLNDCQREAVAFALNQSEIGVVHGPPGTGKTTTVIEIILQAVKRLDFKVLVCAPSNIAVDNLAQKLSKGDVKIIRLGHPGRTLPEVQELTLDATILHSDASLVVKGVRQDMSNIQRKIQKSKNKGEVASLRKELHHLQKELRYRENKAIKDVLTSAHVILATTTTASVEGPLKHLTEHNFDLVIIDEAAQALECSCWIPLLQGQRCILAGDHHQLPPTIISHEAAAKGLEVTLMERITKAMGDQVTRMLTTQYRMHHDIMKWSSDQLYDGRLVADESVKQHLLTDLDGVVWSDDTSVPVLFIDTAGCHLYELVTDESESKGNEGEVEIVEKHIDALIQNGIQQRDVGVITPYNLQVELIRARLTLKYPHLEIRSVDGFQGREKEAIVISLVRSNDKGEIGFLSEDRRMNVAITRARRHLAVIGDSETISKHDFLKSFYDYVRENGEIRTAAQYSSSTPSSNMEPEESFTSEEMVFAKSPCSKSAECNMGSNRLPSVDKSRPKGKKEKARPVDDDKKGKKSFPKEEISAVKREMSTEDVEAKLSSFVAQDKKQLVFPSSLTPKERARVHELAEEMGLTHVSSGEGASRYLTVCKKENVEHDSLAQGNQSGVEEYQTTRCINCKKDIPTSNFELHSLRCHPPLKEGRNNQNEASSSMHDTVKVKPKGTKSAKSKTTKNKKAEDGNVEDIDALIASFTKEDTHCFYDKCKASVTTLGQQCQFCRHMFCLKHHMAEIHGCGDAVRAHARTESRNAFYNPRPKPLKEGHRRHIKSKLDKKLDDLTQQRKSSSKKKES